MDMRELSAAIAPATTAQVDRVAGRPSLGGLLGVPLSVAGDIAAPVFGALDQGLGAVSRFQDQHPNLGRFFDAAAEGAIAAQGEPLYAEKRNYYNSLATGARQKADATEQFNAAMAKIYQQNPEFDPRNAEHFEEALPFILQEAGPEAAIDFAAQFDPAKRAKEFRDMRRDFIDEQETMDLVDDAYRTVTAVGKGYVAPTVLMTAFAKLIDPGSVVRGEEMRVLEESGGIQQEIYQGLLKLQKGGEMSAPLRNSIVREAARLYNSKAARASAKRRGFTAYAKSQGFDDKKIGAVMSGYNQFAPVASGKQGDLERFEYRPDAPLVPPPPGADSHDVLWDRRAKRWVSVSPDYNMSSGVRIRPLEGVQ